MHFLGWHCWQILALSGFIHSLGPKAFSSACRPQALHLLFCKHAKQTLSWILCFQRDGGKSLSDKFLLHLKQLRVIASS
jgi:hypothetical protein